MEAKQSTIAVLFLGLWTLPAAAGVTGVYQTGEAGTMEVAYRDDNNIRMTMGDGQAIVLKDGHAYMVNGERVTDLKAVRQRMERMGMMGPRKDHGAQSKQQASPTPSAAGLEPTGETTTVAGVEGQVYRTGSSTVVLTEDPDVIQLQQAMQTLSSQMAAAMAGGMGQSLGAFDRMPKGVLKAEGFQLRRIERGSIPADRFTLPAEPTAMDRPAGSRDHGHNPGGDGSGGDTLAEDAQDLGGNAAGAAHQTFQQEMDQEMQKEAKEKAKGVVDSIFGN